MIKKPYVRPSVSKVEVDSDIIRMLTKQGFAELFWERLQEARKVDACITQEAVFDMMNEKYLKVIGSNRYSSFDSFRIGRDKKNP